MKKKPARKLKKTRPGKAGPVKIRMKARILDDGKGRFPTEKKNISLCMRMPDSLHEDVHKRAKKLGISYQQYVRKALERALIKKR